MCINLQDKEKKKLGPRGSVYLGVSVLIYHNLCTLQDGELPALFSLSVLKKGTFVLYIITCSSNLCESVEVFTIYCINVVNTSFPSIYLTLFKNQF